MAKKRMKRALDELTESEVDESPAPVVSAVSSEAMSSVVSFPPILNRGFKYPSALPRNTGLSIFSAGTSAGTLAAIPFSCNSLSLANSAHALSSEYGSLDSMINQCLFNKSVSAVAEGDVVIEQTPGPPVAISQMHIPGQSYTTVVRVVRIFTDYFEGERQDPFSKCVVYDFTEFLAELVIPSKVKVDWAKCLQEGGIYALENVICDSTNGSIHFLDRSYCLLFSKETNIRPLPQNRVDMISPYFVKDFLEISALHVSKSKFLVDIMGIVLAVGRGGGPLIGNAAFKKLICLYLVDNSYCTKPAEIEVDKATARRFPDVFRRSVKERFIMVASGLCVNMGAEPGTLSLKTTPWSFFNTELCNHWRAPILTGWVKTFPARKMQKIELDLKGHPVVKDLRAEKAFLINASYNTAFKNDSAISDYTGMCASCDEKVFESPWVYDYCKGCGTPRTVLIRCVIDRKPDGIDRSIPRRLHLSYVESGPNLKRPAGKLPMQFHAAKL